MNKLALFDIDGTILPKGYGIFYVAENLANENLIDPSAPLKMAQARTDYRNGKMEYEDYSKQVQIEFAKGVKGFSKSEVEKRSQEIVLELENTFYQYALHLIPELNKTHDVYFITANIDFYADAFTKYYQSKGYKASKLATDDQGKYTGEFEYSLSHAQHKKDAIENLLKDYPREDSMAFGDADADRFMLDHVEHAICIDPTDNLAREAKEKNWIITDPEHAEEVIKKLL